MNTARRDQYILSVSAVQQVMDDEELRELFIETWPKACSCGEKITEENWEKLRYVGVQKGVPEYFIPDLELRNCGRCNSTIAIVVTGDFVEEA